MKIGIKISLVLGTVLLICSWTTAALGQEAREEYSKQLQEALGLTDKQIEAIQAEQQAIEAHAHDLRVQIRRFDEQIYQAAEQTGDPMTVGKLVLEKIAVQKQIGSEEASLRQRLDEILTPQQQDRLKQLREADQLFRGWEALFTGRLIERREALEVGGGGGLRLKRERPAKK